MLAARCPMPEFRDAAGRVLQEALIWQRYHWGLRGAWGAWRRGEAVSERLTEPPSRVGPLALGAREGFESLRWVPHWTLRARGRALCIRCGAGPHKTFGRTLDSWPCPGHRPLCAAARVAVSGPSFGAALQAAPPLWREKVAREMA